MHHLYPSDEKLFCIGPLGPLACPGPMGSRWRAVVRRVAFHVLDASTEPGEPFGLRRSGRMILRIRVLDARLLSHDSEGRSGGMS